MVYDLEFPDGTIKKYSANLIAEHMLTQVDSDGFTLTMMEGIIGHYKDETTAISKEDKYIACPRRTRRLRKTTLGWKLLVKWKNGSES